MVYPLTSVASPVNNNSNVVDHAFSVLQAPQEPMVDLIHSAPRPDEARNRESPEQLWKASLEKAKRQSADARAPQDNVSFMYEHQKQFLTHRASSIKKLANSQASNGEVSSGSGKET